MTATGAAMDGMARRAAALWCDDIASVVLAAHRENAVYRVTRTDGSALALRLHRMAYRSDGELQSELDYMAALAAGGLAVPQPLPSHNGHVIEHVEGTQVSALTWLQGRPLGQTGVPLQVEDRVGTFARLGLLIARLHDLSDAWSPPPQFTRQRWDVDGLLGEQPQWGRFWDNPLLTPSQANLLQRARIKLASVLQSPSFDQGLIHADFVSENLMLDGDHIQLIDFDDSGFGFRLQDVATALVKHRAESDYHHLRAALVRGYRTRRPLDDADIELFLLMRHLSYVGWIVPRLANAGGEARSRNFIATVMPMAEAFLDDA